MLYMRDNATLRNHGSLNDNHNVSLVIPTCELLVRKPWDITKATQSVSIAFGYAS